MRFPGTQGEHAPAQRGLVHCSRKGQVRTLKVMTIASAPCCFTGFQCALLFQGGTADLTGLPVDGEGVLVEARVGLGLGGVVQQDGGDHAGAPLQRGGDESGGRVAGVEVVLSGLHPVLGQALLDRRGRLHIGHGGVGGEHVRDQVRCRRDPGFGFGFGGSLAGLGEVDLVAHPEQVFALGRPAGIGVVGRGQAELAGRDTLVVGVPLLDHLPSPGVGVQVIGLHEDLPQEPHRLHLTNPAGGVGGPRRPAQRQGILPEDLREPVAFRLRGRHPPAVHPRPVTVGELGHIDLSGQPGRCRDRECLQSCPHALPGEFQTVQVPHRADHMGGIGALLAPGGHQALVLAVFQEPVEDHPFHAVPGQPGAEPAQHARVEARVRQLGPERVLPVDRPHRHRRGLPVGQVLGELQHRDQRQHSR
ncbi:hypothetical protein SALBM311S_11447 [Streptomyces alboniger]